MEHGDYPITVYNQQGTAIGQKSRRDIDKARDIFRAVYVLLIDKDHRLLLVRLPDSQHYRGKLGITAASILRTGETNDVGARRAVETDLGCQPDTLQFLGESFEDLDATHAPEFLVCYVGQLHGALPDNSNVQPVPLKTIDVFLTTSDCTPTLKIFWKLYSSMVTDLDTQSS